MEYSLIEIAYAALLHDIGKFYQRTYQQSNLNDQEKDTTPLDRSGNYHTHLHSGYTSRFFKKYLNKYNEYEKLTSEHHKKNDDHLSMIIRRADYIASAIDRDDEKSDMDDTNKRGRFITARLHSVMSEVDFDKTKKEMVFPLSSLSEMYLPESNFKEKNIEESANEYKKLFNEFVKNIENDLIFTKAVDINSYHAMYNLLNHYLVTIPASTYEGKKSSVSLFDHLKITSAIASCLWYKECFDTQKFYMLELDISGIQSFIYQITEGASSKPGLTKALRGRSIFVGLITNAIAYAFLKLFGLTESNILFNTGGGAVILLPYGESVKEKVDLEAKRLQKKLFQLFQTDITFAYGIIELNKDELETYQSEKALELKQEVGRNKMRKFHNIIENDAFFFNEIKQNNGCSLCGRPIDDNEEKCQLCQSIEKVSDIYTRNNDFGILYDYDNSFSQIKYNDKLNIGFVNLIFIDKMTYYPKDIYYIDAINHFGFGNQKLIANLVPKNRENNILNFEDISKLLLDRGDSKLGILKMDVDNLGGIFAFGLKKEGEPRVKRAISKYVTLSRLMESFFGHHLVNICQELSIQLNENIIDMIDNQTMFYINYAGGDDLVIMGPAYGIVYLAKEINERFQSYTGNDNITISGGIQIQNPKRPIRFGVQEAEKQLECSKQGEKHAITLMDTTISFDEYNNVLSQVEYYCQLVHQQKISRTMLYNIMSNIRDKSYEEFIYLIPRIQYILFRNLDINKNKDIYEKIKKDLVFFQDDEGLKKYVLILKLVIMFTRNNENKE